jgi:hypothetical protein
MTAYGLLEWADVMYGRLDPGWDAPLVLQLLWSAVPVMVCWVLILFRWAARYWVASTLLGQDRKAYDAVWRQVCTSSHNNDYQEEAATSFESLLRVAAAASALAPPGQPPVLLQRHRGSYMSWAIRPPLESVELIFWQAAVAAPYLRQHVQVCNVNTTKLDTNLPTHHDEVKRRSHEGSPASEPVLD